MPWWEAARRLFRLQSAITQHLSTTSSLTITFDLQDRVDVTKMKYVAAIGVYYPDGTPSSASPPSPLPPAITSTTTIDLDSADAAGGFVASAEKASTAKRCLVGLCVVAYPSLEFVYSQVTAVRLLGLIVAVSAFLGLTLMQFPRIDPH